MLIALMLAALFLRLYDLNRIPPGPFTMKRRPPCWRVRSPAVNLSPPLFPTTPVTKLCTIT
jgi:hypothetical protein